MKIRIALLSILAATAALATDLDQARALIEANRLGEAKALLVETVKDPGTKGESLVLLTRLSNLKGDYESGVGYGKQAVAILPASSDAHYQYAVAIRIKMEKVSKVRAMISLGDYKDALAEAIRLDPRNVRAREEEIGFLLNAPGIAGGGVEKARRKIEELKAIDERSATEWQAVALRKEGNLDGAIKLLKESLEKDADDHELRFTLAMTLQDAKRYQEAEQEFARLAQVKDVTWALAATYQRARVRILGRYEQDRAIELFLDFISKAPDKGTQLPSKSAAYWRLGNAYEQLKQLDKARQAYEEAIALDPDNDEAKKALKALPKR